ncbi:Ribosomal large subunit pseudouridine synthase B [Fusobacterium sp. DD29]|nr:Ribosomal large subunit pseudouridine synthase B [Fusobacterium sp. DD45]MBR8711496.1 Ribosomal large subunit pseudouridine synthase B [Fusobacterium sp. DD28]MBR8749824.1 Ribosomal large subunit pseudouridine synthase B [Fusobacterium sp. DD29]MBR8752045.1 Ribosomal large subunit pseudouridine synthase B [Fusobacterium sp. DD26]MBR8762066.1 Ribosomal large subunit pseudouridine synthase B [Fusobacterium sp. DD25]MBR8768103.1 Ribosomal large subunit pseudouridine synthase B [Fusobacterium s
MEEMRINKYLASLGIGSRRAIDKMIDDRRIRVNGEVISAGVKVTDDDLIEIDGKKISKEAEKKVYYLLNKPLEVLSSAKDDRGRKTVVDLIRCKERIFPVGRLDYNTTGLIILTNDGELFNKVIHPRAELYKQYYVKVLGEIKDSSLEMLRNGVKLEDGMTLPAIVKLIKREKGKSEVEISIREGRNRQVRRMFDSVNHPVITLKREKIGKISIGKLRLGEYRELTKEEINYLYSL